jgi:hypothetical protein
MLPCTQKISELGFTPKGIILSGGPYSVYEEGSPHVDPAVFELSKMPLFKSKNNLLTLLLHRCSYPWHMLYVAAELSSISQLLACILKAATNLDRRHAGDGVSSKLR